MFKDKNLLKNIIIFKKLHITFKKIKIFTPTRPSSLLLEGVLLHISIPSATFNRV